MLYLGSSRISPILEMGIRRKISSGEFTMPTTSFVFSLPNEITSIGAYSLAQAYYGCTAITAVDLSHITSISKANAMTSSFQNCTNMLTTDMSNLTTVSSTNGMSSAFRGCTKLTDADLSSLTTISSSSGMAYIFNGCSKLTDVDFSNLTTVSGASGMAYAMQNCTSLKSVEFPSLTTLSGGSAMNQTFRGDTNLESVSFPELTTIGSNTSAANSQHFSYAFNGCTKLTTLTFPKLQYIYCTGTVNTGTFGYNNTLQKIYLPKLTTITYGSGAAATNQVACQNIFANCGALTEIHFGEDNRAAIEATAGYSTAWGRGAGNVTIYFDL